MTQRMRAPSAVRTAVVWDALRPVLADRVATTGRESLDVLDAGGGTGGFAVPLAELGHRVTVVDPSPDSLATLARRAEDARVTGRVRALQGDTDDVLGIAGEEGVDLVLCHSVLEVVDDPLAALVAAAGVLRAGGTVSVIVANRGGAVLHRALVGRLEEAHQVLTDADGRWGDTDPVPRRFTEAMLTDLVQRAGLKPVTVHGVRVFADIVPGSLLDGETVAAESLLTLETVAAEHPELRSVATQLHVLAQKLGGAG